MKESTIVSKFCEKVQQLPGGALVEKRHGSVFSKGGKADVMVVYQGRHIEIEFKQPGNGAKSYPTPLQARWLDAVNAAGGFGTYATDYLEALYFTEICHTHPTDARQIVARRRQVMIDDLARLAARSRRSAPA
jgi:penicillin-binding protein-related factor A (putative recombinase)